MIDKTVMSENNIIYTALIGNVDASFMSVDLGDGFSVQETNISDLMSAYAKLHGLSSDHADMLAYRTGFRTSRSKKSGYGYIVRKEFHRPYRKDKEENTISAIAALIAQHKPDAEKPLLDKQIRKLRLFAGGSIRVIAEFFSSRRDGAWEINALFEWSSNGRNQLYRIKKSELSDLNQFLALDILETKHRYIHLALDSYYESYEIRQHALEFLALMIALEALFNDGKQELRYKLSRGCAVLLGKSIDESRHIFRDIKNLYDLRSTLVHTGDMKRITEREVVLLKEYVRSSLKRVLEINMSKEDLLNQLIASGFGSINNLLNSQNK